MKRLGFVVAAAAMACPGVAAAQAPAKVVPAPVTGGAMLVRVELNTYKAYMQVDTGATTSVIDSRIVKKAGLATQGEPVKATTIGCTVTSQPVLATNVRIGAVPAPDATILATRQPGKVPTYKGLDVIGLLGNDILAGFGTVGTDFLDERLVLGGTLPDTGRELDSLTLKDPDTGQVALFAAKAKVGGRDAVFAVDTGAALSVVDTAAVKRLKLKTIKRKLKVTTPGCTTKVKPVLIRKWSSGTKLPADVGLSRRTGLRKLGLDGLIGASVLGAFGQATFDYTTGRIALGFPAPAGSEPAPAPDSTYAVRHRTLRAYRL